MARTNPYGERVPSIREYILSIPYPTFFTNAEVVRAFRDDHGYIINEGGVRTITKQLHKEGLLKRTHLNGTAVAYRVLTTEEHAERNMR